MMILRMGRGRRPRAQPTGLVQRMADWRRQSAMRAMARGHRPGFRTEIQEILAKINGRSYAAVS